MRIRFIFKVRFIDTASGSELDAVSFVQDVKLSEDTLDSYLNTEIADEGVVGGELYLKRTATGQPAIEVTYWHPSTPSNRLVDSLQAYTVSQLEDGIGEVGFEFTSAPRKQGFTKCSRALDSRCSYRSPHIDLGVGLFVRKVKVF